MMWLLLCCCAILLFPVERIQIAGEWLIQFRVFFSLGLLIACSYFFSQLLLIVWDHAIAHWSERQKHQYLQRMIERLDFTEKAILREFVIQRKSVINLPLTEPAVKNLLDAGVLDFAYGQPLNDDLSQIKALMISLEARPLLTYKALGLSNGKMTEEQVEMIMSARPKYVSKSSLR
jgi:hypothetical protein